MITYPDSVQYLYALGNEIKSAKLGLDRVRAVLDELGNPDRRFRVVHVAGTNGKGSTCAMIEAGLREAGYRTGLTISPHLVEPTERIQIDGTPIGREEFVWAFEAVHEAALRLVDRGAIDNHPTYFETVTAMAFVVFARRNVDWAVVEVGLGGRLDATNVVMPELCVITPVDFDHERWLGKTLGEIAGEKAGILKSGVAAVVGPQHPVARLVIEAAARRVGAGIEWSEGWATENLTIDELASRFELSHGSRRLLVSCPLAGEHQVGNARTAAVALHKLGAGPAGIAATRWPGRLERVGARPTVILDGAHNPAGVRVLAAYVERFLAGRRVWLVYATMRDKAVDEITGVLVPLAHRVVLTEAASDRSLRAEVLRDMIEHPHVTATANLGEALARIRHEAAEDDVILITGSLYLIGEARAMLRV